MSDCIGGKLQIQRLHLSTLCKNPAIVIITKRGGGKTWVCRSLLDQFRDIPVGVIISHTEKDDHFFQKFFPDAFIYDDYTPVVFKKIVARQVMILDKAKRKAKEGKKIDTRLFLLMDDCLSNSKVWSKDEALKKILFDGRHLDITYVLTMQASLGIPPELRENFDYVLLMEMDSINEQKKLFDHYVGTFPNFNAFREVYAKLTENYGVMVVKKRDAGKRTNEKIFSFRSRDIKPAMIGCKQLLKYHDLNYDPEWLQKSFMRIADADPFAADKKNKTVEVEVMR